MFQGRVPRRRRFVTLTAALMFAGLVRVRLAARAPAVYRNSHHRGPMTDLTP